MKLWNYVTMLALLCSTLALTGCGKVASLAFKAIGRSGVRVAPRAAPMFVNRAPLAGPQKMVPVFVPRDHVAVNPNAVRNAVPKGGHEGGPWGEVGKFGVKHGMNQFKDDKKDKR